MDSHRWLQIAIGIMLMVVIGTLRGINIKLDILIDRASGPTAQDIRGAVAEAREMTGKTNLVTTDTFKFPSTPHKVTEWTSVRVINDEPIKNRYIEFHSGDSCWLREGGTVRSLARESPNGQWILLYEIAGEQYGTPCPSGVIFYATQKELDEMTKTK